MNHCIICNAKLNGENCICSHCLAEMMSVGSEVNYGGESFDTRYFDSE